MARPALRMAAVAASVVRQVGTAAAFGVGVAWNLGVAFCLVDALPEAVTDHFGRSALFG